MTDLTGKTIAKRYRVDSLLGRGGMGDVYKVWDGQRAVFLAMKVLHADLAEDRVFLRRFAREAETLSTLQHPHIVRFYGLEQNNGLTFMLMDYVEGTTLRKQIFDAHKPLPSKQILQIIRPVCSALHYAHKMGRVHCDIKPANIMVKATGEVLVADFGIARMLESSTTMTMAGAGTPAYMAPEQVMGKQPSPQTDIYALGIVLYEMFTGGERPFTGEQAKIDGSTSEKVRWEQSKLKPPSPREHNPAISRDLEKVVLKCLEKEPAGRYSSALELLNAVGFALGSVEETQDFVTETTPIEEFAERERTPKQKESPKPVAEKKAMQMRRATVGIIMIGIGLLVLASSISFFAKGSGLSTSYATVTPTTTSTPTFTPTATPLPTEITDDKSAQMVLVPAGEFTMGSSADTALAECKKFRSDCQRDWFIDEEPEHTVYLDSYYIDKYEVSKALYADCVKTGACQQRYDSGRSTDINNEPANYVTWYMAYSYCGWRGARLPTEAEWEKAARGINGRTYPWGNSFDGTKVNFCDKNCSRPLANNMNYDDGYEGLASVDAFPNGASVYGVFNLAGNLREWVADWYARDYYVNSPYKNPQGPGSGYERIIRGGGFYISYGDDVRSANRGDHSEPQNGNNDIGFRCARSAP